MLLGMCTGALGGLMQARELGAAGLVVLGAGVGQVWPCVWLESAYACACVSDGREGGGAGAGQVQTRSEKGVCAWACVHKYEHNCVHVLFILCAFVCSTACLPVYLSA